MSCEGIPDLSAPFTISGFFEKWWELTTFSFKCMPVRATLEVLPMAIVLLLLLAWGTSKAWKTITRK